jgi:hypothetical protein
MRPFDGNFYYANGFFGVILFIRGQSSVPATATAVSGIVGCRKHPAYVMTAAF